MRNASVSGKNSWLPLLVLSTCCCAAVTVEAGAGYSIPADAIRIGAEELAAEQLTAHLAGLMGSANSSSSGGSSAQENYLEGQEEEEEADDHRLPTALVRLNALLRAAEERKERFESTAATSRLLSINRGGYFRGLLIVWVPVSFLLPTLARHPNHYREYREYREYGEYRGRRRAGGDRGAINEILGYDPDAVDYKFDSHYGPLLSRLEAYFGLLRIENLHCRWKLLCHTSRRPDNYQPLSNLFRRLFERSQSKKSAQSSQYHPALKKFFTYTWADKKGARFSSPDQCDAEYPLCPAPVDRLIRMDMILFWQKLSNRFAIQLQDE